jgi:LPXTG-site transpeptidase (sortase) family protein
MLVMMIVFPTVVGAQENQTTLNIPSLAISAPITEINIRQFPDNSITWDATNLGMNIGHLAGTAWLDTPGNIVLGGHSELEQRTPGIFYTLDQIQLGDVIVLSTADETRQYTVTQVYQVPYTDLGPVYPTDGERLTLITCDTGSYNTATGTYSNRIIVVAERVA